MTTLGGLRLALTVNMTNHMHVALSLAIALSPALSACVAEEEGIEVNEVGQAVMGLPQCSAVTLYCSYVHYSGGGEDPFTAQFADGNCNFFAVNGGVNTCGLLTTNYASATYTTNTCRFTACSGPMTPE